MVKKINSLKGIVLLSLLLNSFGAFARYSNNKLIDSLPVFRQSTVPISFGFKQVTLNQPAALNIIDSVIKFLLQRPGIAIAIVGYADVEEGTNASCYTISLNRALAVKDFLISHKIDSNRIIGLKGFGSLRLGNPTVSKKKIDYNYRVEIILYYPISHASTLINDRDGDGIPDNEDQCPDEYGTEENKGCPDKNVIIVPFEPTQYSLYGGTYAVLDSIINILLKNPFAVIVISGHAYKTEGGKTACMLLSQDRALIIINYLVSRRIKISRIINVKSYGDMKPLNAGRNPLEIIRNSRCEIYIEQR